MSALILDAGAMVAVDRGDRAMIARLRVAQQHGVELRSNAMVVAQVWRDRHGRQVGRLHAQRLLRREIPVGGRARHLGAIGGVRDRRWRTHAEELGGRVHQRLARTRLLVGAGIGTSCLLGEGLGTDRFPIGAGIGTDPLPVGLAIGPNRCGACLGAGARLTRGSASR